MRRKRRNEQGFTLVEVVVSMLIMSVVALTLINGFGVISRANQKAQTIQNANTIITDVWENLLEVRNSYDVCGYENNYEGAVLTTSSTIARYDANGYWKGARTADGKYVRFEKIGGEYFAVVSEIVDIPQMYADIEGSGTGSGGGTDPATPTPGSFAVKANGTNELLETRGYDTLFAKLIEDEFTSFADFSSSQADSLAINAVFTAADDQAVGEVLMNSLAAFEAAAAADENLVIPDEGAIRTIIEQKIQRKISINLGEKLDSSGEKVCSFAAIYKMPAATDIKITGESTYVYFSENYPLTNVPSDLVADLSGQTKTDDNMILSEMEINGDVSKLNNIYIYFTPMTVQEKNPEVYLSKTSSYQIKKVSVIVDPTLDATGTSRLYVLNSLKFNSINNLLEVALNGTVPTGESYVVSTNATKSANSSWDRKKSTYTDGGYGTTDATEGYLKGFDISPYKDGANQTQNSATYVKSDKNGIYIQIGVYRISSPETYATELDTARRYAKRNVHVVFIK